jgi:HEAT repeat protein
LHAALLDESGLVRSVAQFHLTKIEAIDLHRFYREAVCRSERRLLKAALGGLGETGRATDAHLVIPLLDAPEAKIRSAALGALAKLALEPHLDLFVQALQSSSAGVSRQARFALERHSETVGAERLALIFAETPHAHVRREALRLMDRLSKWQKLPLLIEIFGGSDSATRKTAENFLRSWLANYNRTHNLQPTKAEVVRLRGAMQTKGLKLEGRLGVELRALVHSLE